MLRGDHRVAPYFLLDSLYVRSNMKTIHSVTASAYTPTKPLMPTHYEMEVVDTGRSDEAPVLTETALLPSGTFERRAIGRIGHLIDNMRKDVYLSKYYEKAFFHVANHSFWYDMPQPQLSNNIFKLVSSKEYRLQFTASETKHIQAMITGYTVYVEQETDRRDRNKKPYTEKSDDLVNIKLLTSLLKKYKFQ